MKQKTLFTISAVLMFLFSIGFVLMPATAFLFYGVRLDAVGILLANAFGAALFGLGLLAWLFRDHQDAGVSRLVATAIFGFFIIKTIVTLISQLGGEAMNALGWSVVAIDGLLTLGYGYFLIFNPPSDTQHTVT